MARPNASVKVLAEEPCPRCHANAQVRAEAARKESDAFAMVFRCDKCKFYKVMGFTTKRGIQLRKHRAALLTRLAETDDPDEIGELTQKIHEIDREEHIRGLIG